MSYKYEPLVSIVIPAYNASNYLSDAIESALAQTYKKIEIIVVNDGSQDNGATENVALAYGTKIRYFHKENGGSSSALNCGIRNMRGEWFSWLSHDDLYYPEKIESQVRYLNQIDTENHNISDNILFTGSELVDANAMLIRKPSTKNLLQISEKINNIPGNEYLIAEPTHNYFHGCGCLVHKSVFEKIGFFNEKLRLVNDYDMWYRIYSKGYKIHFIPQILVKGRVHGKQVSVSAGYSYHNAEQDMFWTRSLEWLESNFPEKFELFYMFGKNALQKTRYIEGRKAFAIAKKLRPNYRLRLSVQETIINMKAQIRTIGKKIYLIYNTNKKNWSKNCNED